MDLERIFRNKPYVKSRVAVHSDVVNAVRNYFTTCNSSDNGAMNFGGIYLKVKASLSERDLDNLRRGSMDIVPNFRKDDLFHAIGNVRDGGVRDDKLEEDYKLLVQYDDVFLDKQAPLFQSITKLPAKIEHESAHVRNNDYAKGKGLDAVKAGMNEMVAIAKDYIPLKSLF